MVMVFGYTLFYKNKSTQAHTHSWILFFYYVCVCIYPDMMFFTLLYLVSICFYIVYTLCSVYRNMWVTYFHKWKFCFVFHHWSYHEFGCATYICSCIHMFVYFYCMYIVQYKMPQITTRPFTFNYSFHQCIKKSTHSHTDTHPPAPTSWVSFIRFSHRRSSFFLLSFHLSQAQQIAFARSFQPLLWLSMSCAHNHVYRIYHVNFSALPTSSLPLPVFHFICQYYSFSLAPSLLPLQSFLYTFAWFYCHLCFRVYFCYLCQTIWTMESHFASVRLRVRKQTAVAFFLL